MQEKWWLTWQGLRKLHAHIDAEDWLEKQTLAKRIDKSGAQAAFRWARKRKRLPGISQTFLST